MNDNRDRNRMTDDGDKLMLTASDLKEQPKVVKFILAALAVGILVMVMYIVGRSAPFEPLSVSEISIEPISACGGEETFVSYTSTLETGWYRVDSIKGFTFWTTDTDPRPFDSLYFDIQELEPYEDVTNEGPTRRVAPSVAGDWYAGVDATLYASRLGFIPVEQKLQINSDDYVTSLDRTSEECVGEND